MPEQIVIDILPDGAVRLEVNGVAGSGCQDLTRELERSLGRTVSEEIKDEYYVQGIGERAHLGNA